MTNRCTGLAEHLDVARTGQARREKEKEGKRENLPRANVYGIMYPFSKVPTDATNTLSLSSLAHSYSSDKVPSHEAHHHQEYVANNTNEPLRHRDRHSLRTTRCGVATSLDRRRDSKPHMRPTHHVSPFRSLDNGKEAANNRNHYRIRMAVFQGAKARRLRLVQRYRTGLFDARANRVAQAHSEGNIIDVLRVQAIEQRICDSFGADKKGAAGEGAAGKEKSGRSLLGKGWRWC